MKKKYALQKGTAILGTGLIVFAMGSCAIKIDDPIITPSPKTTQEQQLTEKELETTTFSIFEDPDTIELPVTTTIQQKTTIPEIITMPQKEEITTTMPIKLEEGYYSRFTNQQQLETYLEQIYNESGKDYWTIINELETNEDYFANRSDLIAAAAYMLLKDNGLSLEDVAIELDYLLCLVNNPRGESDEDRQVLNILYKVTEGRKVYPIFEQLALEIHLIMCPNKNNHKKEIGRIICIELDEQKIYLLLVEKNKDKDNDNEFEIGPVLIKKIRQLIEQNS